jgi:tetratricopeptide (TPR) repeat protein
LEAIHQLGLPAPSKLYHACGQAHETLGEFEHARSDYEQALNAARKAHDGVAEWQSFIDLGSLWAGRDYAQTYEHFQRAFELARAMGEPWILAHSLNRVGNWHLNAEEPREALQYHQEALAAFQRLNDQRGLAETLDLLGMASYLGGDAIQSAVYYEQATEQFRIIEDRKGLISSLATLMICGGNYQTETMVPAATSFAESLRRGELALKIAREIDQRSGEAYSLFQLGGCLGPRGEYARALELAKLSIEIAELAQATGSTLRRGAWPRQLLCKVISCGQNRSSMPRPVRILLPRRLDNAGYGVHAQNSRLLVVMLSWPWRLPTS